MKTLDLIRNSKLHDYELEKINLDYQNANIQLKLRDLQGRICELDVNSYIFFSMTHDEPWGKGKYIVSSDVVNDGDIICIEIQLNSGDKCIIHIMDK